MSKYKVKYEIDVYADSPKDAALQVEQILNEMDYRPFLTVIDEAENAFDIDLDAEND